MDVGGESEVNPWNLDGDYKEKGDSWLTKVVRLSGPGHEDTGRDTLLSHRCRVLVRETKEAVGVSGTGRERVVRLVDERPRVVLTPKTWTLSLSRRLGRCECLKATVFGRKS